jgi:predicted transposase/invertase (TIGR01784 family)
MILGIDPKVDYAFKHLLGREATRPILIDLINSVLRRGAGRQVEEIELLNPFNPKETATDKLSILDVKARDQSGRQFNVEMQVVTFRAYEKRILYYWCKLHQQQLQEGVDYWQLKPTVSISFLENVLFPQVPEYHLQFRLGEVRHQIPLTEDIEFHVIELPKFTKAEEALADDLDNWLYFLKHAEKMDTGSLPTFIQRRPHLLRALGELEMMTQDAAERELYESRRKAQLDYNTAIKTALMDGRVEGVARGEQIGRIHLCERLLNCPETPTEQLASLSVDDLTKLADEWTAKLTSAR